MRQGERRPIRQRHDGPSLRHVESEEKRGRTLLESSQGQAGDCAGPSAAVSADGLASKESRPRRQGPPMRGLAPLQEERGQQGEGNGRPVLEWKRPGRRTSRPSLGLVPFRLSARAQAQRGASPGRPDSISRRRPSGQIALAGPASRRWCPARELDTGRDGRLSRRFAPTRQGFPPSCSTRKSICFLFFVFVFYNQIVILGVFSKLDGNQLPSKTASQCVQFYYLWKKVCRPQEYASIKRGHVVGTAASQSSPTTSLAVRLNFDDDGGMRGSLAGANEISPG